VGNRFDGWNCRDLERLVKAAGWRWVRSSGGHRHYTHPKKPGIVTIPWHPGRALKLKTTKSIFAQAGMTPPKRT
jgi:predicted RNA binding protein YcfA (HicA-like mRNA interferase family)